MSRASVNLVYFLSEHNFHGSISREKVILYELCVNVVKTRRDVCVFVRARARVRVRVRVLILS